ncbi:hypothetical protein HPB47_001116 [Ixodes persulcatus]|uniref:Uncharacterized protein n=1 Tax=Ixodes persulcatus TaxID=34615 RepID=A0AC60PPZ6_IXOPE|nr:hypothetical protein HPB47_001116 [Ixodes persulcatus]
MLKTAQLDRLKSTEPGRAILRHVGYDTDSLPQIPLLSLEETTIQLTTLAPLPRNMGKDYEARRQHRAREHEVFVKDCTVDTTNLFVYTDAAIGKDDRTSIGIHILNTMTTSSRRINEERSTKEAELQAILEGARQAVCQQNAYTDPFDFIWVFTDSRDAYAECQDVSSYNTTVRQLRTLAQFLALDGRTLQVGWVPGHSGIHGNEEAHNAAKAALESASVLPNQDQQGVSREGENNVLPFNPDAFLSLKRKHRREILAAQIPPDPHGTLPTRFSRADRVILRRIRTRTAMTPALQYKFGLTRRRGHSDDPPPVVAGECDRCKSGQQATLEHLVWGCTATERIRRSVLRGLPHQLRPTNFQEWTSPEGEQVDREAVLQSLLKFIREAGIRHLF